jgi:hypothetical protein
MAHTVGFTLPHFFSLCFESAVQSYNDSQPRVETQTPAE